MEEKTEHYAGFWIRFFACSIDLSIYSIPYGLMLLAIPDELTVEVVFALFALWTYAWFFSCPWQASPGMYMLKIHVRHQNGQRLTFRQALMWGIVSSAGWMLVLAAVLYLNYHYHVEEALSFMLINPGDPRVEQILGASLENYLNVALTALGVTGLLALVWSLSIALTKEKTGFHNIVCHTRFFRGRAEEFNHA